MMQRGAAFDGLLSASATPRDTGYCLPDFVGASLPGPSDATVVDTLRFCPQCGSPQVSISPAGEQETRRVVCGDCGSVHYKNPRIVVRCIAEHNGSVLLCQRASEPRRSRWSIPGGYVESGEEIHFAAARETLEEAGVAVDGIRLAAVYEFPQIDEIIMICKAEAREMRITLGVECSDARFFAAHELSTTELAFPTDSVALGRHFGGSSRQLPQVEWAQFFWDRDGRILVRDQ